MARRALTIVLFIACPLVQAMSPAASLELSRENYGSIETSAGGSVLNQEDGWLNGVAAGLGAQGKAGGWTLQATHARGSPAYRGMSQGGTALRTTTKLRIRRLSLRWEPPWQSRIGPVGLAGYAEVARQRVDRAIQPGAQSLPLREQLDATWLRGGVLVRAPLGEAWSLLANAQLSWPLEQQLGVSAPDSYDPFKLAPGQRLSNRISAGMAWRATPRLRVELWISGDYWRYGASGQRPVMREGEPAGMAEYPGSRHALHGLRLRLETLL